MESRFGEAAYSLIKPDPFRLCLQTVFCSNASGPLSLSLFSRSLSDLSIERTPVEGNPSSPKSRLSSVRPNELLNYPESTTISSPPPLQTKARSA